MTIPKSSRVLSNLTGRATSRLLEPLQIRRDPVRCYPVYQVGDIPNRERTFLGLQFQSCCSNRSQDLPQVRQMAFKRLGIDDDDVIQINQCHPILQRAYNSVRRPLEDCRSIRQAEGHLSELVDIVDRPVCRKSLSLHPRVASRPTSSRQGDPEC